MAKYFITSSGTGLGKTLVTSALAYALKQSGKEVTAIKPVISGYEFGKESDLNALCFATGLPNNVESHECISLYRYSPALSPDMVVRNYGGEFDYNELLSFIGKFKDQENLLIEGVGGVLVPFDARYTTADLMRSLDMEVILVAGSYLGSLSHTLSAYQILSNYGLKIKAVIVTENIATGEELYIPLAETIKSLSNFIRENIIGLEYIAGSTQERITRAAKKLTGAINGL